MRESERFVLPHDGADAHRLRADLVHRLRRTRGLDERVLSVIERVPRHWFVEADLEDAYHDGPRAIGWGQTISQPTVVAMMTSALDLRGGEAVLEIGTGSGYQAAVLSLLAASVRSIELLPQLAERARAVLLAGGFTNVEVRVGDGYRGWPEAAPFDRILVTAAAPEMPPALVEQLREGGVLVAPIGPQGETQRLERWTKRAGEIAREDLGAVVFVPLVPATL
jgi:protein-L-isoaspartate(D-aspartate) O-methyltransferase